jgi:hypothetical protein
MNAGKHEYPMIFSTPMVHAVREGKKTMTRRIIKTPDHVAKITLENKNMIQILFFWTNDPGYSFQFAGKRNQKYHISDRLWVRETWYYETAWEDSTAGEPDLPSGRYKHRYIFKADSLDYPVNVGPGGHGWRPSMFMPREAARIFLEITDVRIERLQDITLSDARAEGFNCLLCKDKASDCPNIVDFCFGDYVAEGCFSGYWEKLNSGRGFGWHKNPWVYAISFKDISP